MLLRSVLLRHISLVKKREMSQFHIKISALSSWIRDQDEEREDTEEEYEEPYADVPRPAKKWQRKPYPTPMKELIRRAKEEKRARQNSPCRLLENAPENGLLVPDLIEVAYQVYNANEILLLGLSKLVDGDSAIPVKKCRYISSSVIL